MNKLILADCSPSVYTVVQGAFPETEFEIFPFSDGAVMIKELETIQPDVVLLNLSLDTTDGYEVCNFLNSQEKFRAIPIFLLKSAFDRVDEERVEKLEYRELVEEPFDSMRLLQKVREALGGEPDTHTLPEAPMTAEDLSVGADLENKIRNLVAEHIRESENRIVARLKARGLEVLEKEE